MATLQLLVANVSRKVSRRSLNGREYLVAPIALINPGVLNGSRGPLLYPPSEVSKDPDMWNNVPITVGHPIDDDKQPTSARNPDILNKVGIGYLFNTRVNGKLVADGWFDIERTRKVAPEILEALNSGTRVEVSTGLFTENTPKDGTFNGKQYKAVARNYRPDHLAILLGSKGACSIDDGCGLNVNRSNVSQGDAGMERKFAYLALNVEGDTVIENGPNKGKKFDDISDEELTVMCDEYSKKRKVKNEQADKAIALLNERGCTWNEEKREFEGCPKAVVTENSEVTEDEWLAVAPPGIREDVKFARNERERRRDEMIDRIIANESNKFTKDELIAMSPETLQKMADSFAPVVDTAVDRIAVGIANQSKEDSEDVLLPPTINFKKAAG